MKIRNWVINLLERYLTRLTKREQLALMLMANGKWWTGRLLVRASVGHLPRGVVYVVLGRLIEAGYVTHRTDWSGPRRGERFYLITPEGIKWVKDVLDAEHRGKEESK